MAGKKFYDIHFHALNLSHTDLLAFITRIKWPLLCMASPLAPLAALICGDKIRNVRNLLSIMENDAGSLFLLVEHYLKKMGTVKVEEDTFDICCLKFDGLVITPLLMDFGYKSMLPDSFYNILPRKPIVEQVVDVFNGIARYCANELVEVANPDGTKAYEVIPRASKAIFEIYPFLGINTRNYDLPRIEKMFDKYFADYRGQYSDFRGNMGKFTGDIEEMGSNFFAGVKLYPPIGFDPWPAGDAAEMAKVDHLYRVCCDRQIPLTVHCSDGGFVLDGRAGEFTSPGRWEGVLSQERFQTLKLNFAHFGKQNRKKYGLFRRNDWRDTLLRLTRDYPNVYTDFSHLTLESDDYRILNDISHKNPHVADRILFGSDFMINLLDIESYNRYLQVFSGTLYFDDADKDKFCHKNPERFLWQDQGNQ